MTGWLDGEVDGRGGLFCFCNCNIYINIDISINSDSLGKVDGPVDWRAGRLRVGSEEIGLV